jgi:transposase-like protein
MKFFKRSIGMRIERYSVNTADAARYIGVSESLLRKMRTVGNGPNYSKVNQKVVYPLSELKKFVEKNLVDGGDK